MNEAFARVYFRGENPVGRTAPLLKGKDVTVPMQIIGLAGNAVYNDLREPIRPTVYVPLQARNHGTVLVRTAADPQSLASTLRQEISRARLTVEQIQPHGALIRWRLVRERLLATLSAFFAVVALVLAAVGVYGVLNYSVSQRLREIGIRMALGAQPGHVVRGVTGDTALIVCIGSVVGLAAGMAAGRLIEALLYDIKLTGLGHHRGADAHHRRSCVYRFNTAGAARDASRSIADTEERVSSVSSITNRGARAVRDGPFVTPM